MNGLPFSRNLRLLRLRARLTQEEAAKAIGLTRSAWTNYETEVAEPALEVLLKIADFLRVTVDSLIRIDLADQNERSLESLSISREMDPFGRSVRVLATTVNPDNEDNVELVPVKARAGYLSGYGDPDYIKVLQCFSMPFLNAQRKHRTFQISGDSMPPLTENAWVTGEYVQDWTNIKSGNPYIIVTKQEGIVFKIVSNQIKAARNLKLHSTNEQYPPYEVNVDDIVEIWRFVHYINDSFPSALKN